MPHILLLGTADTKLAELLYLRSCILVHSPDARVTFLDFGRTPFTHPAIDISPAQLLTYGGDEASTPTTVEELGRLARGDLLAIMSKLAVACVRDLLAPARDGHPLHGVVAAGGSSNTAVAAAVMQACPIGLPKLLVSTVASGDAAPIIGAADIALMYSVVDIAGLNHVLRTVLDNAAAAIAGMATAYAAPQRTPRPGDRVPQIGVTMFGVTTPGVDAARRRLEASGAEIYVFHATGTGGQAMERLVREGALDAVLDLTTTEVCDCVVGGVMSAGPERLRAAPQAGIPCLVSLGACDMVNFGARESVPEKFAARKLLVHNAMVTLMRTSREECVLVGQSIARSLLEYAKDRARVELWIPAGGISMIATPGGPFYDEEADEALFGTLLEELQGSGIRVVRDQRAINDEGLATAMADRLLELMQNNK